METIFAFLTVIAVILATLYSFVWSGLWLTILRVPAIGLAALAEVKWPAYWVPFFAWSWLAVRFFA